MSKAGKKETLTKDQLFILRWLMAEIDQDEDPIMFISEFVNPSTIEEEPSVRNAYGRLSLLEKFGVLQAFGSEGVTLYKHIEEAQNL